MTEIVLRRDALKIGARHYFTGKPCKHGHVAKRLIGGSCMECNRHHSRNWVKNNPGKAKVDPASEHERNLMRKYGMTLADYAEMLAAQNYCCAICGKQFERHEYRAGSVRDTHIDHDHGTGKVRGILCHSCNHGLGCFNDDRQHLANASNFLA